MQLFENNAQIEDFISEQLQEFMFDIINAETVTSMENKLNIAIINKCLDAHLTINMDEYKVSIIYELGNIKIFVGNKQFDLKVN